MSEDQDVILLLRIVSGPSAGMAARIPDDRPLLIGRAPESDLSIPSDGELSALHFSVERDSGGYLLRDLGSRNGTRINRERAREAWLREGDEVRAGGTAFAVVRRPEVQRPTAPAPPSRARRNLSGGPFAAAVRRRLREESAPLFAVLDAARDPRIRLLLSEGGVQVASLYAGFQGAVLADVGPTLVHLPSDARELDALVECGWGESWGVFMTSRLPFADVRKHLRRFLLVESAAGKQQYFRFYDPRVLRTFLPASPPRQIEALFEDVESFSMEAEDPGKLHRFTLQGGRAVRQEWVLDRAG